MKHKEKNILTEIGDKLKELGEELKPHLDKAEKKVRDFDKAIEPSLAELGEKFKELGSVFKAPMEDLSKNMKEWKDSVKPVIDDMRDRIRQWKKPEKKDDKGKKIKRRKS
jgi:gas vesicle protein